MAPRSRTFGVTFWSISSAAGEQILELVDLQHVAPGALLLQPQALRPCSVDDQQLAPDRLVEDSRQELDRRVDRRVRQRALAATAGIGERHAATRRLANLLALELLGLHVAIDRRVVQLRQPQRCERRQQVICQEIAVVLVGALLVGRPATSQPARRKLMEGRVIERGRLRCRRLPQAGLDLREDVLQLDPGARLRPAIELRTQVDAVAAAVGPHAQVPGRQPILALVREHLPGRACIWRPAAAPRGCHSAAPFQSVSSLGGVGRKLCPVMADRKEVAVRALARPAPSLAALRRAVPSSV